MQGVKIPVQAELLLTSMAIAATLLHIMFSLRHQFLPCCPVPFLNVSLLLQVDIDGVNKVAHQCKNRIDRLMKMNEAALNRKVSNILCPPCRRSSLFAHTTVLYQEHVRKPFSAQERQSCKQGLAAELSSQSA